jgi:Putative RNA methylase family UPF0020
MFVLAVPGLGPLVRQEIAGLDGIRVTGLGNDGRSDVVLCEVDDGREQALLGLRTVEDAFVELGRTLRAEGDRPEWIARRILRPARLARCVLVWQRHSGSTHARSTQSGPIRSRPGRQRRGHGTGPTSYRIVARVLQERSWHRTQLRRVLADAIAQAEPHWKTADPADVELWALEYARGRFVAGVRLTTARTRQHGGRSTERPGALRPTVAAAMVMLAGRPDRDGAALLDPCCGAGTILSEAKAAGWAVQGRDIDRDAVSASRRNLGGRVVTEGDARSLDLPDGSVAACVSNLPFGHRYEVPGDPAVWIESVLTELARVTRPGGRIVLLVPDLPRAAVPATLRRLDHHTLRLLGQPTAIWSFRRR